MKSLDKISFSFFFIINIGYPQYLILFFTTMENNVTGYNMGICKSFITYEMFFL